VPPSRSILIVAQHAPPSPLVGARRPAALAKYLTRLGHRVTVLTSLASGAGPVPEARTVRSRDLLTTPLNWRRQSLQVQQGAAQGTYAQASALESLVPPDLSLISWTPFAVARALRESPACVITTGPPQSAHLVGAALRARGAAWVADLRDGWTFDPPHAPWASPVLESVDSWLERSLLGRADRVVAVTEPIAADLRGRLDVPVDVITNGFDPEDRVGSADGILDPGRFSLVHTGRLLAVGDAPRVLLEAALDAGAGEAADRPLEVVFAGPLSGAETDLVADPRYAGVARAVGNLERADALALQREADALVVMATGTATRPSRSIATGKLFEYLAAQRPILVMGDDSAAAGIVAAAGAGLVAPADDPAGVAAVLGELTAGGPDASAAAAQGYGWPALAEDYEAAIEAAVSARRGG